MEGKIEGAKRRGRQRNTWGGDILKWTDKSYEECVRLAEEIIEGEVRTKVYWRTREMRSEDGLPERTASVTPGCDPRSVRRAASPIVPAVVTTISICVKVQ